MSSKTGKRHQPLWRRRISGSLQMLWSTGRPHRCSNAAIPSILDARPCDREDKRCADWPSSRPGQSPAEGRPTAL